MRFLRTNTETRITVGPFLDKTDGITPETALTVTNCQINMTVDNNGIPELVLSAISPTPSGGNNDMVHITNDTAGFYDLELTAQNTNYVGRAMLAITDSANHCPVFHELSIIPAKVYDSLILGSDILETDTIALSGSGQSLIDLKDFVDIGYNPITHKIEGVVITDTATTVTNNVGITPTGIDNILDEVIENTLTLREALKVFFGVLGGKSSGGGTSTLIFRDHADSLNRITATVDNNGNRTAVTLNVT